MTEKQRVGDEPFYLPSSAGRGPPSRHRSSSPGIFGKIGLVQPSLHMCVCPLTRLWNAPGQS